MKRFILNFVKSSAKGFGLSCLAGSVGTSLFVLTSKEPKFKMEEFQGNNFQIIENAKKTLLREEAQVLVLFGPDELLPQYKNQCDVLIAQLKSKYPATEVMVLPSSAKEHFEGDSKEKLQESFGFMKRSGDMAISYFDHYMFIMSFQKIEKFFEAIPVLKDLKSLAHLTKFEMVIAACEADSRSRNFLKTLSARPGFDDNSIHFLEFEKCENFKSSSSDLLLIKKHSKFNSSSALPEISKDGVNLDFKALQNLISNKDKNLEEVDTDIATSFSKMSIFDPLCFSDILSKQFSVILNVDKNTATNSEVHNLLKLIRSSKSSLDQEVLNNCNFYFRPKALKGESARVLVIDEVSHGLRVYYQGQNNSRETQKSLEDKYPFLLNDKHNTFVYKFSPQTNQLASTKSSELNSFITRIANQQESCYHKNEAPHFWKTSRKLTKSTLRETIATPGKKLVCYYNKNCPESLKFLETFEKVCRELDSEGKMAELEYFRINSELNYAFTNTPVLAVHDSKTKHLVYYKGDTDSLDNLKEFIISLLE